MSMENVISLCVASFGAGFLISAIIFGILLPAHLEALKEKVKP